ncbi:MAG: tetratricopeptide repeat protein [Nitrospirae bacterium]|nr:tetratricopeptide repeat protein [Nitrospirota bacterium]
MAHNKRRDKLTLSLCMITKDEENYLEDCLESIHSIVDEIIIVDTGSKDKTVEISKKYNSKVFNFEWCNDFSEARNFSLSKATCDKILVLDADEIISDLDLPRMAKLLKSKKELSYSFITRNYTDLWEEANWKPVDFAYQKESKGFSGWILSEKVRLFPNDRRILFNGKVHELVEQSLFKLNGRILKSNIPIHNYGLVRKDRTDKSHANKDTSYLKIYEKEILANTASIETLKRAAIIYKNTGAINKSIDTLKQVLSIKSDSWETCAFLASIYAEQGSHELAIEYYQRAIQIHPHDTQLHNNLGSSYLEIGKEDEAVSEWEKALKINSDYILSNINLAGLYLKNKGYERAIKLYKHVLEIHPNNTKALINLGFIHDQMGEYADSAIYYCKIFDKEPNNAEAHNNLGVVLSKLNMNNDAIKEFKLAIQYNPRYSEAYNNLGVIFMREGLYQEAIEMFEKAISYKPEYANAYYNLGKCYEITHNDDLAKEQYRKALKLRNEMGIDET